MDETVDGTAKQGVGQRLGHEFEHKFKIHGAVVYPGERSQLELPIARLPTQTMLSLPITIVNGHKPGPRLWLSAAIHGDEINGVEIIRQVLERISPEQLRGTLVAVPIVNVFGFIEQSRYLPDRRDLNRSFPGSARGSLAARLAHLFMQEVVNRCTHGIDLHTASSHRTNWPHIRANLHDSETNRCAQAFGTPLLIHAAMRDGSLRQAAARQGIPILLYEAGEALRFDPEAIQTGVAGVLRVMALLNMIQARVSDPAIAPLSVSETKWVRTPSSGILHSHVTLGQSVKRKQTLGTITDSFGGRATKVVSPADGLVICTMLNPLVNQGDGIFHIALCRHT
ncbi:MAG: succinylglutamate desuccinylase/aspartoacylase family protein [Leptolyngbyaceae bacterium]|nr:succinylglutamate desuccinylase/aspartoacylase family protein [Leptolyngbyaceae bacterium]